MSDAWLVIDLNTGAQDGFYFSRADAEQARGRHQQRHPDQQWLVALVDFQRNPPASIPNRMFWTERLGYI